MARDRATLPRAVVAPPLLTPARVLCLAHPWWAPGRTLETVPMAVCLWFPCFAVHPRQRKRRRDRQRRRSRAAPRPRCRARGPSPAPRRAPHRKRPRPRARAPLRRRPAPRAALRRPRRPAARRQAWARPPQRTRCGRLIPFPRPTFPAPTMARWRLRAAPPCPASPARRLRTQRWTCHGLPR